MMGACGADDDANCFDFDNWSEKRVLKWPLTFKEVAPSVNRARFQQNCSEKVLT
jgi:hypothetical protein